MTWSCYDGMDMRLHVHCVANPSAEVDLSGRSLGFGSAPEAEAGPDVFLGRGPNGRKRHIANQTRSGHGRLTVLVTFIRDVTSSSSRSHLRQAVAAHVSDTEDGYARELANQGRETLSTTPRHV